MLVTEHFPGVPHPSCESRKLSRNGTTRRRTVPAWASRSRRPSFFEPSFVGLSRRTARPAVGFPSIHACFLWWAEHISSGGKPVARRPLGQSTDEPTLMNCVTCLEGIVVSEPLGRKHNYDYRNSILCGEADAWKTQDESAGQTQQRLAKRRAHAAGQRTRRRDR